MNSSSVSNPFIATTINKSQNEEPPIKIERFAIKRGFDIAFSLSVLLIGLPIFSLIAAIIKCSSSGKVIYSQPRLGRGGSVFKCYKFRTMHENAEEILEGILKSDLKLYEEWKKKQKLKEDPRVFYFGKFLRKTSLDELPQFWNVLIGDLSIVGPRPYMVSQKKDLGKRANKILSVRPGITGLWQTSGRSQTTFYKRILLDEQYVIRRSFFYDLYLIIKTIYVIVINKDAY